jgi:exodeoxyribonuclease-3
VLSLLTINLQATGLPRAAKIYDWLADRDDHAAVLTETSNGPGTAHLLDRFRAEGRTVLGMRSPDGDRGAAIVSRLAMTPRPDVTASISHVGRAVAVTLATDPAITLLGIYVPSSDRKPAKVAKKRAFLSSVLAAIESMTDDERAGLVLVGDYNVISRDHRPRYPAFQPFEYEFLDGIAELGMTDAYEHLNPGRQVHSWYGRGGNGYRFDYFHTGAAVTSQLVSCDYLQQPRLLGITDHAAVSMDLSVSATPVGSPEE